MTNRCSLRHRTFKNLISYYRIFLWPSTGLSNETRTCTSRRITTTWAGAMSTIRDTGHIVITCRAESMFVTIATGVRRRPTTPGLVSGSGITVVQEFRLPATGPVRSRRRAAVPCHRPALDPAQFHRRAVAPCHQPVLDPARFRRPVAALCHRPALDLAQCRHRAVAPCRRAVADLARFRRLAAPHCHQRVPGRLRA